MNERDRLIKAIKHPEWLLAVVFRRLSPFIKNDKFYLRILYFLEMKGKILHLENPRTFTEKLQWLKIYDYKPEYTQMVDKLVVKDYVASRIGKEYIIPTLAVWRRLTGILCLTSSF